jgi:3-oxoacyl-(acyl-carrier-protein) synthase
MSENKDIVITGIGVLTAAGIGKQEAWSGLLSGKSFLSPINDFDTTRYTSKVAGKIRDFDPTTFLNPRVIAQTDRWTHFDLINTQEALRDAGIDLHDEDPTKIAAVFSAGTGGNNFGQQQLHLCWEQGPNYVSAFQSIAWFYAASIGQVSIQQGVRGYGRNICAEAAGGLIALAHAAKIIHQGVCDVAIVGGSEAPLSPYALACYQASGFVSPATGEMPYRPFDKSRSGAVLGEGGAAFCVESRQHALKRNAHIYATISGSGQTFDGISSREPASDGAQYARAMTQALSSARLHPSEINWIICDGLGTRNGDISEVRALHSTFGDELAAIPASAPKSMFGRLFNGGAHVDVASALLGMEENIVLPTIGYTEPDPECDIDCVPGEPRSQRIQNILIGARGFGGFNAALVLSRA